MASGLGNPPYDSSVAYLSGSFPEKGYDEVCLSFADLPYFSAPWHLQGAVASGMAGISGNTGVLCCCGLFQKIEERKKAELREKQLKKDEEQKVLDEQFSGINQGALAFLNAVNNN